MLVESLLERGCYQRTGCPHRLIWNPDLAECIPRFPLEALRTTSREQSNRTTTTSHHAYQRAYRYRTVFPSKSPLADNLPALATSNILLVPYSAHHVPAYHEWMKDPELQELTASEPLTLSEEYSMQRSWRTDADKLTFIICLPLPDLSSRQHVEGTVDDADDRMAGDINLFLTEDDGTEDAAQQHLIGEVEIMIARKDMHRRGLGRAALLTFLSYILDHLPQLLAEYTHGTGSSSKTVRLSFLRVKIGAENARSIALFESVGFVKTSETPNYFGEIEMRLSMGTTGGSAREIVEVKKGFEAPRELKYVLP